MESLVFYKDSKTKNHIAKTKNLKETYTTLKNSGVKIYFVYIYLLGCQNEFQNNHYLWQFPVSRKNNDKKYLLYKEILKQVSNIINHVFSRNTYELADVNDANWDHVLQIKELYVSYDIFKPLTNLLKDKVVQKLLKSYYTLPSLRFVLENLELNIYSKMNRKEKITVYDVIQCLDKQQHYY